MTKINLSSGEGYKVYKQCFDADNIYLQLEEVEVLKNDTNHVVIIPVWMWENIRKVSLPIDVDLVVMTEEEIQKKASEEVDIRIRELSLFGGEDNMAKLIKMENYAIFGDVRESKENQIKKAISYYLKQRDKQKNILRKINFNSQL